MLSEDEQYDTVFSKGKFLDIVIEGTTKYVLYALDMFFAYYIFLFSTFAQIIFGKHLIQNP
jgi:hypothetical protein